jgi:RNA polymerase sigma-70 factor, ECF subfamily
MTAPPTFEEVLQKGLPYVLHVLHRLGVDERDREDRVQDVLLAVHQSLSTFDHTRPLRPWLHGITFHVVTNQRPRRERLMDDEAEPIDTALDPEQATAEARDRARLHQWMQQLDLDHRVVISMHIDGIEMPDIVRELGIALPTGYKRLATAKERLQAAAMREAARDRRVAEGGVAAVPFSLAAFLALDRAIPEVAADVRALVLSRVHAEIARRALAAVGGASPVQGSGAPPALGLAARAAPHAVPFLFGAFGGAVVGAAAMYAYVVKPAPLPAEPTATSASIALVYPVASVRAPVRARQRTGRDTW